MLVLCVRSAAGGGANEGELVESPEQQQRAAAVRALAASARTQVLRPSGLCPPWDADGDGHGDREDEVADGDGAVADAGAAGEEEGKTAGQGSDGAVWSRSMCFVFASCTPDGFTPRAPLFVIYSAGSA